MFINPLITLTLKYNLFIHCCISQTVLYLKLEMLSGYFLWRVYNLWQSVFIPPRAMLFGHILLKEDVTFRYISLSFKSCKGMISYLNYIDRIIFLANQITCMNSLEKKLHSDSICLNCVCNLC